MDKYKEILTATLDSFSDLCEREGLRWYMAFGSAIGAVRHGGIIPWDDDIDVYMPRADVRRLIGLKAPEGYEILHYSKNPSLPFTYVKYCDACSTVWEQYKYPYVSGVFIDVFILDEAPSADVANLRKSFTDKLIRHKRSIRQTTFKTWWHASVHDKLATIQDMLWYRPHKAACYRQLLAADNALEAISAKGGDRFVIYDNIYDDGKVVYDKAFFDSVQTIAFEGLDCPLPSGNHKLLTQIYGDYMTPPPAEKQVCGHRPYFIDLEHRLTIEQIPTVK